MESGWKDVESRGLQRAKGRSQSLGVEEEDSGGEEEGFGGLNQVNLTEGNLSVRLNEENLWNFHRYSGRRRESIQGGFEDLHEIYDRP